MRKACIKQKKTEFIRMGIDNLKIEWIFLLFDNT